MRVLSTDTAVDVVDARRWRDGSAEAFSDEVVVEEPLTVLIRHDDAEHVLGSTMRTPGDDDELAVGMAVGERLVAERAQIVDVERDPTCEAGARVVLHLRDDVHVDLARLGRVSTPTSACGLCGRDDLDALLEAVIGEPLPPAPGMNVLASLPDRLLQSQHHFHRTGGLHAAGLASADGSLVCVREDVGRHNAVDKAVGWATLNDIQPSALVVSGRAGFEIVQKAIAARLPALVSVSATTSRAVTAARAAGLTLACFARDGGMTVYSPW